MATEGPLLTYLEWAVFYFELFTSVVDCGYGEDTEEEPRRAFRQREADCRCSSMRCGSEADRAGEDAPRPHCRCDGEADRYLTAVLHSARERYAAD